MINISNSLKQACNSNKLTYREYVVLTGTTTQIDVATELYASAYKDTHFIGTFNMKYIKFTTSNDVQYINKELTLYKEINGEAFKVGNFIVTEIKDNDSNEEVTVTAYDYGLKFAQPYQTELAYGNGNITLKDVLDEVCEKVGVELVNTPLTNGNFIVDSNQFADGQLYGDVISAIAFISGNFATINNENKLELIFNTPTNEIIEDYVDLEDKRDTHPITSVSIGVSNIEGENVVLKDQNLINQYGEHWLIINDVPFAYTQAKREQLITAIFNKVKGFGYSSFKSEYAFKPYLTVGDLIQFRNKEGQLVNSIILRMTTKYDEIVLEAPSVTNAIIEYQTPLSAIDVAKRTEIVVNKQNQEIELLASKTEETTKTLKTDKSVESNGEEIYIEDSGGYDLEKLRIDGKSEQNGIPTPDTPVEIESVGYTNLLNNNNYSLGNINAAGNDEIGTTTYRFNEYNPVKGGTKIYLLKALCIYYYDKNKGIISVDTYGGLEKTTPSGTAYVRFRTFASDFDTFNNEDYMVSYEPIISYIPYNKYGIDVNVTGKNLLNNILETQTLNGITFTKNIDGTILLNGTATTQTELLIGTATLKSGSYKASIDVNASTSTYYVRIGEGTTSSSPFIVNVGMGDNEFTLSATKTIGALLIIRSGQTLNNVLFKPMIRLSSIAATEYEPYKSNTTQLILNEPLRSLPNGVKDTYENGVITRRVGRVVLDGSENWQLRSNDETNYCYSSTNAISNFYLADKIRNGGLSNYFKVGYRAGFSAALNSGIGIFFHPTDTNHYVYLVIDKLTTVTDLQTWLSENNVEVLYELAEPVIEEVKFVSIPTFENINHINLDSGISTSFGITYLTDSKLNQQFATKSEIKIATDEVDILSQKVQPVSNTIKGVGQIQLENAYEGILHRLSIKGNISVITPIQGEYGYALVPSEKLTPSTTLTPSHPVPNQNIIIGENNNLIIDDIEYELDFNFLNYINDTDCDEFIYEDGKCWIIRRIGIDSNGNLYATGQEVIEPRKDIVLNVKSNSTIKLKSFDNAIYETQYLLENEYTSNFVTAVDAIARINLSPGTAVIEASKLAQITADKINLEGYTTINEGFSVDLEGNATMNDATINGGDIILKDTQNNPKMLIVDEDNKNIKTTYGSRYIKMINEWGYIWEAHNTNFNQLYLQSQNGASIDINNDNSRNHIQFVSSDGNKKTVIYNSNSTNQIYLDDYANDVELIMNSNGSGDGNPYFKVSKGSSFSSMSQNGVWSPGFNNNSLESKKKNIEFDNGCLQEILNTDICSYNWNFEDDEDQKHIGLIIPDKGGNYNISPKVLTHDKDAVDLYSMVGMSWKAIQELYDIIKEKDNKIKELEEQLNGVK